MNDQILSGRLSDDGTYPNNDRLPLLIYRGAVDLAGPDPAGRLERRFQRHGWDGCWRDGIYTYHHYHSTAHEVLGVAAGSASVQLGGEEGPVFEVSAGDVVVIPAGVAHKNLGASADFLVVGAYPSGQTFDMNTGKDGERPEADRNIARTPLPDTDPVYGAKGPLVARWTEGSAAS